MYIHMYCSRTIVDTALISFNLELRNEPAAGF